MDPERELDVALAAALDGGEVGLQVAAVRGDRVLVSRSAGSMDGDGRPVGEGTVFVVFSAGKAAVATAVHVLVDRGRLDYDVAVCDLWPEFGAHGKEAVTVEEVLSHSAGIPQMPEGVSVGEMCDLERMTEAMAALAPMWPPGSRTGYHGYTFGWVLAEVVRRADAAGRSFVRFVGEEVFEPLGIEAAWFGLPDDRLADVAAIDDDRYVEKRGPLLSLAIPAHLAPSASVFMRREVLQSVHPAAGAVADATSLARLYASLCPGSSGATVLSEAARRAVAGPGIERFDECLEAPVRRSLGFVVVSEPGGVMGNPRTGSFGHPGAGGSIGWADPQAGAGFAIVKNAMTSVRGDDQSAIVRIADALRRLVVEAE